MSKPTARQSFESNLGDVTRLCFENLSQHWFQDKSVQTLITLMIGKVYDRMYAFLSCYKAFMLCRFRSEAQVYIFWSRSDPDRVASVLGCPDICAPVVLCALLQDTRVHRPHLLPRRPRCLNRSVLFKSQELFNKAEKSDLREILYWHLALKEDQLWTFLTYKFNLKFSMMYWI